MRSRIKGPRGAGLSVLALGLGLALLPWAAGQWPPPTAAAAGFVSTTVVSGLSSPTAFAFAPDGRIFIAEKGGAVRIVKQGVLLPTPFFTVEPNQAAEHGLVGLALDPAFASNGYVYLYYVYDVDPANPTAPKTSRLVRVTASGDAAVPGSLVVLLGTVAGTPSNPSCDGQPAGADCIPADAGQHVAGALRFGPDGKLWVSTGDAALHGSAQSLRAQNLDSLAGKLLRINPDGTGPADNPFYNGDPHANRSKVWALGFRNPFRFGLQPGTGVPFVGDVGSSLFEEVDAALRGANLGWPCYEGTVVQPDYDHFATCQDLYATPGAVTPPFYYFARPRQGGAVTGGAFYEGSNYPADYLGQYFFANSVSGQVFTLSPVTGVATEILTNTDAAVDFVPGPNGDIYYLSFLAGELRRIDWFSGNRPPVAVASADKVAGLAPLTVSFKGSDSWDPDGDPLTYFWEFGDGGTSTAADPTHTYTSNGDRVARLTVTDPSSATGVTTLLIRVGKQPPQVVIDAPLNGALRPPGETVVFAGHATDPEDGPLPASSLHWAIVQRHCVAVIYCHTHPFLETTGFGGTYVAPNHGVEGSDFFYLEIMLTATDSDGIVGTRTIKVGADLNNDGCMDAYWPLQTDSLPFLVGSSGPVALPAQTPSMAFAHSADATTGAFAAISGLALIDEGTQYAGSIALLLGGFSVGAGQSYTLSFDSTAGRYLAAASGGATSGAGVAFHAAVLRASDGALVAPVALLSSTAVGAAPGLPDVTDAPPPEQRIRSVAFDLPAGSYYWVFAVQTASAAIKAGPGPETSAASGVVGSLYRVVVCQPPTISTTGVEPASPAEARPEVPGVREPAAAALAAGAHAALLEAIRRAGETVVQRR